MSSSKASFSINLADLQKGSKQLQSIDTNNKEYSACNKAEGKRSLNIDIKAKESLVAVYDKYQGDLDLM